jgi:glucose/arabinose dehydrogenase
MNRFSKKKLPLYIIGAIILVSLTLNIPFARSHSASKVTAEYNESTQNLNVVIMHTVGDVNAHYIKTVIIEKNGNPVKTEAYSSQPSQTEFTYIYSIVAEKGDSIKVSAGCNLGGILTTTIIVGEEGSSLSLPGWYPHFILTLIGLIAMIVGIILAVRAKGKKRLKIHKPIEWIGVICFTVGVIISGFIFYDIHPYIGLISALGCFGVFLEGYVFLKSKKNKKKLREMHILSGRIFVTVMLIATILGFALINWFQPPKQEAPPGQTIVSNLQIPWSADFLPDGGIIFTERPGRVNVYDNQSKLHVIYTLNNTPSGPTVGGALGIALDPDFNNTRFVFLYHSYQSTNNKTFNRVSRFHLGQDNTVTGFTAILDPIPGSDFRNGGRIKFSPSGYLFISTGDILPSEAQNLTSYAGKILRIFKNGSIPLDNPFPGSAIYSYGHRHPQGLTFDKTGRVWAVEHGDTAYDEINLIENGKNYGYPNYLGDNVTTGITKAALHSGDETWAPSGISYYNGSLYIAGLRGQSVYVVPKLDDYPLQNLTISAKLTSVYGRIRTIELGPNNQFYILTSNNDGYATVKSQDDDRIIRLNPNEIQ